MRRLLTALIGVTLLAAPITVAVAPAAVAEDCAAIDGCIADGTESSTPPAPKPAPKPKPAGCETTNTCPKDEPSVSTDWYTATKWGGSRFFWQPGSVPLPPPYIQPDYSGLYTLAKCGPREGFADAPYGTTYNLRAGFWVTDTVRHYWSAAYIGSTFSVIEVTEPPVRTYDSQCTAYTVPSPQPQELTSYGELTINGPYAADGKPMQADGGSLTRDSDGDGVPSVQGKTISGVSALGNVILKRLGSKDPSVLRTALPTMREAYNALDTDLSYRTDKPEYLGSFGRYYALSERWRPTPMVVYFRGAYGQYVPQMFPAIFRQAGESYFDDRMDLPPVYIDSMTGPRKVDDVQRFKIYCFALGSKTSYSAGGFEYQPVSGPQPSSFAGLRNALPVMPPAVMDGEWGDNSPTYYSYECKTEPPTPTRENDYLQCDRYDETKVIDRATSPITYSTSTGTRWAHIGWRYWWGTGGNDCGRWSNGDPWCREAVWGWETYTTTTQDPTPPGWTINGTNWVKDCPTGWQATATQCSNTTVGTRIVDRKSAAPITSVMDALLDVTGTQAAEITGETSEAITVREPATGDWLRAVWRKPRINVNVGPNAGKDVNALGASANVVWERQYRLTPTSSPVIRGTSVNDGEQPYHLFTDTTPATDTDRPSADGDWQPLTDDGTDDASLNRWVGVNSPQEQRALWLRWFMSSNAGTQGWTVTPWWRATVTMPLTFDKVVGFTVADDGTVTPVTERVTEDRRESYECPGQRLNVNIQRVAG